MAVLTASGLQRSFGGVHALRHADLEVREGEVHALVGANGAGKSTLVKILAGALQPDAGDIELDGRSLRLTSPLAAAQQGIAVVSQELSVFPELDVLTNQFMPTPPTRFGLLSRRQMRRMAAPAIERMKLDVDLNAPARTLSLSQCQLVEITRALILKPRVLMLDEPNSALQADATQRLLSVVRSLRDSGVGIVFVSHFLEETFAISDVITVVRDGRTVLTRCPVGELTIERVVAEMLGSDRPKSARAEHPPVVQRDKAVVVEGLAASPTLANATLTAHFGEVVALVGLDGSGPHAVLDVLFGRRRADAGQVTLPHRKPLPRNSAAAVRAGIGYVPADRKNHALMLADSISTNLSLVRSVVLGRDERFPSDRRARRRAVADVQSFGIKTAAVGAKVGQLSGGNQQKVALAKWLVTEPDVFLLDDPTRGVDVAAKADLHRLIRAAAADGRVVIVTTSDLAEVAHLADRVVVFYRGRTVGEMPAVHADEETLLNAINTGRMPTPSEAGSMTSTPTP